MNYLKAREVRQMSKINQMKNIVEELLENDLETRKDDAYLYSCACKEYLMRNNIDITPEIASMLNVFSNSVVLKLPNYESVRRTRAKLQSENPNLIDKETAIRRNKSRYMVMQFV